MSLLAGQNLDAAFRTTNCHLFAFWEGFHHIGVGFQTSDQLPADFDVVFDHIAEIDGPANDPLE